MIERPPTLPEIARAVKPGSRGAKLLAVLERLDKSQWWSGEALREHQFRQLGELLAHAARTVPFYHQRFETAKVDLAGPMGPDVWRKIPLLTRRDIQKAGNSLRSRTVPAGHGRLGVAQTSGSTGMPVKLNTTERTRFLWNAFMIRDHLWHRRVFSQKYAAIRKFPTNAASYPKGKHAKSWSPAIGGLFGSGPAAGLGIDASVKQQAEWLGREDPVYLQTYPSNLRHLAVYCERHGIELARLAEVITFGELFDPETREICRRVWNVPVTDMYSSEEVGYIALQCPDHAHYHVQAENVLVEILDDGGEPSAPGEIGKVVVTHLHNYASPFIRYDIGDFAEVGEDCACGRRLPVLRSILGRSRNMIQTPSGDRYWPLFGVRTFTEIAPILQHQFVQKTADVIEGRFVAERALTEHEEERLRRHILSRLPYPFKLVFTYHDEIPRSAGGKYEDFISEIAG